MRTPLAVGRGLVVAAVAIAAVAWTLAPTAARSMSGHAAHATLARPAAEPSPLRAGESLVPLDMTQAYRPKARNGASDDYRCFVLDPGLASDQWLTGTRFRPGNPALVHHIIVFQLDASRVAAARVADAADAGPGWTCFGGPGFATTSQPARTALEAAPWLAAWAPGGDEHLLPDGLGVRLAAGSQVILQVHYNLRAGRGRDVTGLDLRLRKGTDPLTALSTRLVAAPVELPCPPGDKGPLCSRTASIADTVRRFGFDAMATINGLASVCNPTAPTPGPGTTQTCAWLQRDPVTVYAAAPHMHLLGQSMRIEANPGTPRAATLLDVPVYDFDRQGAIWLPQPVTLRAGDVVRITCTWNPALRRLLPAFAGTKPRYVVWGEGTTDEMCLGVLNVAAG